MEKSSEEQKVRVFGRVIGREVLGSELEQISGGKDKATDSHAGTCTHEADCDAEASASIVE